MVSEEVVHKTFAPLITNEGSFLTHLADDVSRTLTGQDDPLAGHYSTKADVAAKVFAPIYQKIAGSLTAKFVSVLISGDWAIVEFTAKGKTKGGNPYSQELCWICRYEEETIVEVREYLDSAQVKRVLEE
jgi:uncharacterized protein